MSGGTHDYFCFKVDSFIDSLEEFSEREFTGSYVKENKLRNAFIEHMKEVANVARIIEWVDSGDKSEGEEFEPIRKLLKLESK